ncbi:MAG TPA: hypothetical protein VLC07_02355 [Solirubrobacterales bacterium]|nr:hypothetical protein [Solirubrobacterales bacterium]
MGLTYQPPPLSGALRQGEILGPIWDHRALVPPTELPKGQQVAIASSPHPLRVVLSPDCDLLWDFEARFELPDPDRNGDEEPFEQNPDAVTQVLLCDLFSHAQMRARFKGMREQWRRVDQNQDERYHRLDAAPVAESDLSLQRLYLDFKKVTSVPTAALYEGILLGDVKRVALIPDVWIHDLIHRFYGFLSRVAVPDQDE